MYMDMIYNGTQEEKDKISFMMIDEVGMEKITFPFYENFLIQFHRMYGELLQTNTIEESKCEEIAKEVFNMIATVNLPPDTAYDLDQSRNTGGSPSPFNKAKKEFKQGLPSEDSKESKGSIHSASSSPDRYD